MRPDCERARQWASVELDGELSEFEHVLLDGHARACPECNAFRADVARVAKELREAPLERFERAFEVRRIRRARFRLAPAAAALAVTAVGLGSVLTSVQFRNAPEASARSQQSDGQPTRIDTPDAVRRGQAINLSVVGHRDRGNVAVRRQPSDLPGGPVIDKQ